LADAAPQVAVVSGVKADLQAAGTLLVNYKSGAGYYVEPGSTDVEVLSWAG
jgi:hypothetical protein